MAVDNPEAIRFVNEQIRPMAELLEALYAELGGTLADWYRLSGQFATPGDAVEDGRENEGVSRLSAGDVTSFAAQMEAIKGLLDAGGVMDVIRKPTVQPMRPATA